MQLGYEFWRLEFEVGSVPALPQHGVWARPLTPAGRFWAQLQRLNPYLTPPTAQVGSRRPRYGISALRFDLATALTGWPTLAGALLTVGIAGRAGQLALDAAALHTSWVGQLQARAASTVLEASTLAKANVWAPEWTAVLGSWDFATGLTELLLVACGLFLFSRARWAAAWFQHAYSDFLAFCQHNNLSFTEVALLLSTATGLLFFDFFASYAEEDVLDASNYAVLLFILASLAGLLVAIDVQLPFLVSNAIGEPSWRTLALDVINNALCLLRVFTCWLRYVFYDLQVDFVDTALFYVEAPNTLELGTLLAAQEQRVLGVAGEAVTPDVWRLAEALLLGLAALTIDAGAMLVQALLAVFKLFIATFLLWLLLDLFLLRPFADTESRARASRRAAGPQRGRWKTRR